MLRVTTTDQEQTVTLKLEGSLAGPWVQEVTRVWANTARPHECSYVVDLTSVTFIDSPGRALLATMWKRGAQFVATGCLTMSVVSEIQRGLGI
jgi:anti-anti-sigma factor